MCIIAIVSTFYYVFGGLKGVACVTILHSAIKVIGIALILGVALSLTGGIGADDGQSCPPTTSPGTARSALPTIFAWTIGTVGAIFSTQFIMQAISSTPSADDARGADLLRRGASACRSASRSA